MNTAYNSESDGSDVCWSCGRKCNFVCQHCLNNNEDDTYRNNIPEDVTQEPCLKNKSRPLSESKWVELRCVFITDEPELTVELGGSILRLKKHIPWAKSEKGIVFLREKLGNTIKDKFEIVKTIAF